MEKCSQGDLFCKICCKCLTKFKLSSYHLVKNSYYCKKCYIKRYSDSKIPRLKDFSDFKSTVNTIDLNLPRPTTSHHMCIFKCKSQSRLRLLSREECIIIYIKSNIFVPYGLRCCESHENILGSDNPSSCLSECDTTCLTANKIAETLKSFRTFVIKEREKVKQKLAFTNMSDKQLGFETKLNRRQFSELLQQSPE